ncbi:GNAT family N-acetyltransferase [Dactylosporangium matsuzakiense]|uniref:N-acetyltransferase n=1 Tax=Dactylosporangium matsuzakiense TaxID=53360 RepID=A0A9W6KHJ1_9ACTN|nr:GNAT family N-acetyltransferase [Dactylosporangium matsuzakiense]GLL01072.1 N-acetyltransferase [Dactylosporangium matsuzakiense]
MSTVRYRLATADDATAIGALHADSWRRHYRGAYADAYLDGDLVTERRAVWSARLAAPAGTHTVVAERDGCPAGFVHVVLGDDPIWGSLVDNLHVVREQHRSGIGTQLLARAAAAADGPMYLWVLRQNTAAQAFYRAVGGASAGSATVAAPGGDPARLVGSPQKLRMAWADVTALVRRRR